MGRFMMVIQRLDQERAQEVSTAVKVTEYFVSVMSRPDRAGIRPEWIQRVIDSPNKEQIQADGRIRRWAAIPEAGNRYLRVVLLPDGKTVHNVFFDRSFKR
jgi:hypothetical protein